MELESFLDNIRTAQNALYVISLGSVGTFKITEQIEVPKIPILCVRVCVSVFVCVRVTMCL